MYQDFPGPREVGKHCFFFFRSTKWCGRCLPLRQLVHQAGSRSLSLVHVLDWLNGEEGACTSLVLWKKQQTMTRNYSSLVKLDCILLLILLPIITSLWFLLETRSAHVHSSAGNPPNIQAITTEMSFCVQTAGFSAFVWSPGGAHCSAFRVKGGWFDPWQ